MASSFVRPFLRPGRLHMALFRRHASRLVYDEHGAPADVIRRETFPDPQPDSSHSVLVRMQMSPVNPADLNTVQGSYPIRPDSFPAVGGGEGVGVVEWAGPDVTALRAGDWVVPSQNMAGSWSTHMQGLQEDFLKVRNDLPLFSAATLRVNPCTAYLMLHKFCTLQPGDVVIQNGANSACGQAVIQIAKKMGLVSVNVVRKREEEKQTEELRRELQQLGADHVWTEEELRKGLLFRDGTLAKAKLALNCVGGSSATELSKCLGHGGFHVTYGGMSLKPVTAPTSALIFKDMQVRGFWLSRWIKDAADAVKRGDKSYDEERRGMMAYLEDMALKGELRPPKHEVVPMEDYKRVMEKASKGYKGVKYLIDMRGGA